MRALCLKWIKGLTCLLALGILLASATGVSAHAQLDRATPPPDAVLDETPERLQLWFTEPVEPNFSEIQVLDSNGRRVDNGDSRVTPDNPQSMTVTLPPLEKGVYTVAWKNLSTVDGHVVRGAYSLLIGVDAAAAPPPVIESPDRLGIAPLDAPTRWLGYLGAALLVGVWLFVQMTLIPVARRLKLTHSLQPAIADRVRRLLWLGWSLLVIGSLAALLLQAANASGQGVAGAFTSLGALLFATRSGYIWLVRLALLAALAVVLWLWPRQPRLAGLIVLLTSGVMVTNSLNSHSAAVGAQAVQATVIDWLHFMGVAVWIGGLFGLVYLLPRALDALPQGQRWPMLARLIPRFSSLAVASVGVLTATGVYLAWLHVGSLDALWQTLYGKSLAVKLALFAPLLLLGAFNLLVLSPQMASAVAVRGDAIGQGMAKAARLAGQFVRTVRLEVGLAVLVLLAAGMMTSLSPARQTYERLLATRPLAMTAPAEDMRVTLSIAPARPGINTFVVTVRDARGQPVNDAERVDLRFSFLGEDLGTNIQVAQPQGNGQYSVRGGFVGVEGRWQTEILVRRPGQEDARTAFRYVVSPLSAAADTLGQTTAAQPIMPMLIAAGVLAALFVGALAVYVARTSGLRSPAGAATGLVTLAFVVAGIFFGLRATTDDVLASGDIRSVRNPFPPTQESIAQGREIYQVECAACHGVRGRGDGPAAMALNPRPADFRVHMAAGHTDGELYYWLSEGVAGTAMIGFKDRLTPAQRWHVINFIKTFAPVAQ